MNLSESIDQFLVFLKDEKQVSSQTLKNYTHYLRRFREFCPTLIEVENLNRELISKYQIYLNHYSDPKTGQSLSSKTQNYFLIALRGFIDYLAKNRLSGLNAHDIKLSQVEQPKVDDQLAEVDIKRLLQMPDIHNVEGLRDKAMLEILFLTGIRVSELAAINRTDVDLEQNLLHIQGKGGKNRNVILSLEVVDWIKKYLGQRRDEHSPLFIRFQGTDDPGDKGEKMRLSTRSIERAMDKYTKKAHLTVKATPQTLRHHFAFTKVQEGEDMGKLQALLGYSNIATVREYKKAKDE